MVIWDGIEPQFRHCHVSCYFHASSLWTHAIHLPIFLSSFGTSKIIIIKTEWNWPLQNHHKTYQSTNRAHMSTHKLHIHLTYYFSSLHLGIWQNSWTQLSQIAMYLKFQLSNGIDCGNLFSDHVWTQFSNISTIVTIATFWFVCRLGPHLNLVQMEPISRYFLFVKCGSIDLQSDKLQRLITQELKSISN